VAGCSGHVNESLAFLKGCRLLSVSRNVPGMVCAANGRGFC
jgi:hypothetical protein